MNNLIIFGASGHGIVALDAALSTKKFNFMGWIDNNIKEGLTVRGFEVLGQENKLQELFAKQDDLKIFLAISNNYTRYIVYERLRKFLSIESFATIKHSSAIISKDCKIGLGSLILGGAVINPNVNIGIQTIINTSCSIDHDCVVSNFSSILPGTILAGNVIVGERSCLCMSTSVAHEVNIGKDSYVGAGSLVLSDVDNLSFGYGNPYKKIKNRAVDERHF